VTENRTEILFEEVTPFVAGIEPGDILVCNQSVPGAEDGFLERVTGVSNEGGIVEVQVEPATLEDAIEQGVIVVTQTIPLQELMSSAPWASGVEVTEVEAGYNFAYSPAEGVTIEGYVVATTDSDIYINASIWTGLEEFWFIFSPGLEMGVTLTVEEGVSWDKEYRLAELPELTIPVWGPVTITFSIELIVGTDGEITGTLEAGVAYERSYDVGIKYYYGEWSKINEVHGEGATLEPPSFSGHAEARVYTGAALSGKTGISYGIAEAELTGELLGNVLASGEMETSPWRWQYDLELYLTAQVFADLNLLRIAHVGWESDVWQYPDPPYNLAYGTSGRVTENGEGLDDVEINFSAGHSTVTTDTDGYWYKHLLDGDVEATPDKTGYAFDPPSITITGSGSDLDFQAFEAVQPTLSIELTFNPSGPVFDGTGKLNPFAVPEFREAMNWLVDRDYIVDEIMGGLAVSRVCAISTAGVDGTVRFPDTVAALEAKYAYDQAKALDVIESVMTGLGAVKSDGKWMYNGEQVELIGLIRTEDERNQMGDYLADLFDDFGFAVTRQYGGSGVLAPIWQGDPTLGTWSFYTGGWISTLIPQDESSNFGFFYTDLGLEYMQSPLWEAYINDPEFYEAAERLWNYDYTSMAERADLFKTCLEMSLLESQRVWICDRASFSPLQTDVRLTHDAYGGIAGYDAYENRYDTQMVWVNSPYLALIISNRRLENAYDRAIWVATLATL
jgi:hypothetical protein